LIFMLLLWKSRTTTYSITKNSTILEKKAKKKSPKE